MFNAKYVAVCSLDLFLINKIFIAQLLEEFVEF